MAADPDYGFLARLLHRLALQYRPVAETSFDIDQATVRTDPAVAARQRHVFVAGLARAGTTLLMRRFHSTGLYRSLTYRDMPFVLAPNLWRRLTQLSRRDLERAERAHGDSLLVDADSPESLDEVFWRVFAGAEYLRPDCLVPHTPDAGLVDKYVRYVNAILSAQQPRLDRYLAKNNNNILRLGAIRQAFPAALILVPFRQPLQHAHSLLRQHQRFVQLQTQRPFILSYMTWLGHHEFGLGHRPFRFSSGPAQTIAPGELNYWLRLWCETYSWLERNRPQGVVFVCYEDLCTRTATWRRLVQLADLAGAGVSGDELRLSERPVDAVVDRALAAGATSLYDRLVAMSRN